MKIKAYHLLFFSILVVWTSCSTPSENSNGKMEVLPYYDLKGFIEQEVDKFDTAQVVILSRINQEENQSTVTLGRTELLEELDVFLRADINKPSLVNSYTTEVVRDFLIHQSKPKEKTKVKEIKVRIINDRPVWITFKMAEENMFYTSYTIGELYMNSQTDRIDHYSIETSQKIWFLKANNMKISGVIKN
ncbi:hypothetical protein [Algoriphagus sp. CAU 1675]|uniref:hypothetical protein n=1 Tax=Algoriphagus sp. CAU 1675 TaxID=3032597 RepID=UPI0023DA2406|nr:hypothetical protein [Algoriphagus sp. CAU 1675]MDF2156337.1 hypothetical protein [Algoriphagus sp. CAU 1675]